MHVKQKLESCPLLLLHMYFSNRQSIQDMQCKQDRMLFFLYGRYVFILFVIITFASNGEVSATSAKFSQFIQYENFDNYIILTNISSEKTNTSSLKCGRSCTKTSDCEAFSYNVMVGKCMLSNRRTPYRVRREGGWEYYLKPLGNYSYMYFINIHLDYTSKLNCGYKYTMPNIIDHIWGLK